MKAITLKKFRKLTKKDFDNGAVINEIEVALKEREDLIEALAERNAEIIKLIDEMIAQYGKRGILGLGNSPYSEGAKTALTELRDKLFPKE